MFMASQIFKSGSCLQQTIFPDKRFEPELRQISSSGYGPAKLCMDSGYGVRILVREKRVGEAMSKQHTFVSAADSTEAPLFFFLVGVRACGP